MTQKESLIDIKPIDESGVVEIELESTLKLRKEPLNTKVQKPKHASELEKALNDNFDFKAELASIGARVTELELVSSQPQVDLDHVLNEINSAELHLRPPEYTIASDDSNNKGNKKPAGIIFDKPLVRKKKSPYKAIVAASIVVIGFLVWKYGLTIKNNIVNGGNSAILSLEEAKTNLEHLNFTEALANFSNAYEEFSEAGDNLNLMGNLVGNILAEVPGNSQYKSARNLVEAGKLFSKSGQSLAGAVKTISQTGAILDPSSSGSNSISSLKKALLESRANIYKASALLSDSDASIIPEEKRESFNKFTAKLPEMVTLIDRGVEYSMFLESFTAVNGSKQYLVLFQNPSELRPTGGFPGSYGILKFQGGNLGEFRVDDVYNIDGQLKGNIIPPKELQHITPTWAMRDANWFIDFPTSAKKIMQFYKKESGIEVDGVITFSPVIVREMLRILGPVQLPEYDMVLDHNNFLAEIQAEVEYGENRTQSKTILKFFAPRLLEKLHSAEQSKWLEVFNVLVASLKSKDMLMYLKESSLEEFVLSEDFAGEVKNVPNSDYFYLTATNVKGSKTDIVTDTSLKIDTEIKDGEVRHIATITREHNGGKGKVWIL